MKTETNAAPHFFPSPLTFPYFYDFSVLTLNNYSALSNSTSKVTYNTLHIVQIKGSRDSIPSYLFGSGFRFIKYYIARL